MEKSYFQFQEPFLIGLSYKINGEFVEDGKTIPITITPQVTVRKSDKEHNEAFVMLKMIIGSDDSKSPFFITAAEGAVFKWEEEANENIEALLNQNAPALLVSYLRPTIAMITAASPFKSYNIPFLNFVAKDK